MQTTNPTACPISRPNTNDAIQAKFRHERTSRPWLGYVTDIYVDSIYCDGTDDYVYDLLAGPHSVGIRKEGYNYAEKTVEVVSNQITYVHFNLTDESGTVQVMSSPTEARVYVDNDYRGMTSSTQGLVLNSVPVGGHQITVTKDGYAPYIDNVTVEKNQTVSVTATLNNDDQEGDGLLDDCEENGFRDGFGNRHTTETNLVDTDGDGLSDGYEAGFQITDANGRSYFKQRSDATKADTDDDGLDDFWEDYLGTDPYDPDTDHDFVRDGDDDDPLIPTYNTAINDAIRDQVALRLGTIFGETGLRGEICYELIGGDTYSSTPPYVSGWIASGIAVYGDVRDFIYAVSEYDTYGAALTGIGLIPLVGDAEKVGADILKYIGKYPKAICPLGKHLAEQGIIDLFGNNRMQIIDDFFPVGDDGVKVGTRLITEYDLDVDDLVVLMGRGVDLTEVVFVSKRGDGTIIWLEEGFQEGISGYGWIHIKKKHITGEVPRGTLYPSSMTEADVKNLIFETVEHPLATKINQKNIIYYHEMNPPNGQYNSVITNSDGYILSAYMVKKLPSV